jgi:GT2 family glycosyltransferase
LIERTLNGMSFPEVTVVIPTRDRLDRLSRTLLGVFAQQGVNFEVVVVDDGSLDATSSVVQALRCPNVRCVSHRQSLGVARARNAGLAEARGRWVAFLDDDDLWSPVKLREQIAAAEAAGAVFAFSSALVVEQSNRLVPLRAPSPDGLCKRLLTRNVIPAGSSNVVARASVVRALGGFDDRLHAMADWDLWVRLAQAGTAARCSEFHLAYVEHAGSMHVNDLSTMREFALLAEKHRGACRTMGVRFLGEHVDLTIATALLMRGERWAAAKKFLGTAGRYREPELAARAAAAFLGPRARSLARLAWYGRPQAPEWLRAALVERAETASPSI